MDHLEPYSTYSDDELIQLSYGYVEGICTPVLQGGYATEDYGLKSIRAVYRVEDGGGISGNAMPYCEVSCSLSNRIKTSIGKNIAKRTRDLSAEDFVKEYENIE